MSGRNVIIRSRDARPPVLVRIRIPCSLPRTNPLVVVLPHVERNSDFVISMRPEDDEESAGSAYSSSGEVDAADLLSTPMRPTAKGHLPGDEDIRQQTVDLRALGDDKSDAPPAAKRRRVESTAGTPPRTCRVQEARRTRATSPSVPETEDEDAESIKSEASSVTVPEECLETQSPHTLDRVHKWMTSVEKNMKARKE